MKKRFRKKKRETLPKILIKSFSAAVALCLIFAFGLWKYLVNEVQDQAVSRLKENVSDLHSVINQAEAKHPDRDIISQLSGYLSKYVWYDIMLDDPLDQNEPFHIAPGVSDGCYAAALAVDENYDIIADNHKLLQVFIRFSKDAPDSSCFICDEDIMDIPEVHQIYSDYKDFEKEGGLNSSVRMELESAYLNKKDLTFIPHKMKMELIEWERSASGKEYTEKVLRTKEINIDIDNDDFELTELDGITTHNYPVYTMFNIYGEETEAVNKCRADLEYLKHQGFPNDFSGPDNSEGYKINQRLSIYIGQKHYQIYLCYVVKYTTPEFMKFYRKYVILFCLAVLALAALYCWRRNVVNKTKYAMDDYQRDLTNHLAHDIKTPLMAIGGYAENIMEVELTENEKKQYLSAILDNIRFTDSVINRTLFLNSLESGSEMTPEKINVETAVKDALKKYEPILEEKGIRFTVEGNTEIKADKTSFENIIENLISNAVKYTAENGAIKAACERKKLIITNTVSEKIDVKDLKKPFVRGEKSRSNLGGSGLGLSIAERAAALNGFKLNISCTNSEFSAEVSY